ncbi:hypothetical protein GIY62_17285 [Burkholderia plantarii]|uniref:hypothetical protein n=1 Tax=Burkholderia plantarii TaxID=41899 RepID=UPI00272BFE6C|nr:hypothetical protein [Burkholderia plantarii]WLE58839.1 hypothetical protein GIY62_17285 [Burkholderia plantarii]
MISKSIEVEARLMVENFYGESADEIGRHTFPSGHLTEWKNAHSLPTRRICSFLANSGELFLPNDSNVNFMRFLCLTVGGYASAKEFCDIVKLSSPALRKAIVKPYSYMKFASVEWFEPRLNDGEFDGFFENLTSGKIEKINVRRDGNAEIVNVGEGIAFHLT